MESKSELGFTMNSQKKKQHEEEKTAQFVGGEANKRSSIMYENNYNRLID